MTTPSKQTGPRIVNEIIDRRKTNAGKDTDRGGSMVRKENKYCDDWIAIDAYLPFMNLLDD